MRFPGRAALTGLVLATGLSGGITAGAAGAAPVPLRTVLTTVVPAGPEGPAPRFDCTFNVSTDAFTGLDGTASEIGWEGNHQGVVTCLGGTFVIQDGLYQDFGFGIYTGTPTTWKDVDGYLPAQTTTFGRPGVLVAITEFADRIVLGGDAYVAVYSRVAVRNLTGHDIVADPEPSSGLVPLGSVPDVVAPHATVDHDYVVAADRFGNHYPWPGSPALARAGTFNTHFAHMRHFWNSQLAGITELSLPDRSLENAYRSGFVYTQIARSGNDLNTGVNGYQSEYSHDVIGILTNLFTQGYFTDAHALLDEARTVVGSQGQYDDGLWTYSLPWAIYLMKTGDVRFVKQNFDTQGPAGSAQPSIEDAAHAIGADRTGPSGIMEATDDIDFQGLWTTDDFEALLGLWAYRYLAVRLDDRAQVAWATSQYDSLLTATNRTLASTIGRYRLHYLPCSMVEPNTANTCANPVDANWTSPFGLWAWNGNLLGAPLGGPGLSMISETYAYGFQRLSGLLPPDTFGGYPDDYYSTGYNAGQGTAGLATDAYRDQGILSYEFMIANSQSGPYSWWESSTAPSPVTPWIGKHPAAGQGSSPHAWGIAQANNVLLDSLVAQRTNGSVLVGRGVPPRWLDRKSSITVSNFPTLEGKRMKLTIAWSGRMVTLSMSGQTPPGSVLFQLPAFIGNISSTSAGRADRATGTVTLPPHTTGVVVYLDHQPRSSAGS